MGQQSQHTLFGDILVGTKYSLVSVLLNEAKNKLKAYFSRLLSAKRVKRVFSSSFTVHGHDCAAIMRV